MSQKVFNIIIKLTKEGGADTDTVRGLTAIKTAMTQGMAIAGAMVGAYYTVDKLLQATVGEYVKLATEVEKFNQLTGMSMQDSSRLIEVMKDLEISADAVGTAFRFAEKNGFQPNLESLKKMQEQYLALNPGMERTQLLLKEFGKSGTSLQKFFETGDIAQRLDEVNQALVLGDEAKASVQAYKDALDALNDTITGIKIAAGADFLRPLTAVLKMLYEFNAGGEAFIQVLTGIAYALGGQTPEAMEAFNKAFAITGDAVRRVGETFNDQKDKIDGFRQGLDDAGGAAEELVKALADQTKWEVAFTGAETFAKRSEMSFELMGGYLQDMGLEGAEIWSGFLQATGKLSPAAIAEFVRIQAAFEQVRKWLASGMSIPIITNFLTYTLTGSGPQTGTTGGSGWNKIGIVGMGSNPNAEVWENALGQRNIGGPGKALGGAFTENMIRVGERGEEWLARAPGGGVVVLPNDIVRRMEAWGFDPERGFNGGGRVVWERDYGSVADPTRPQVSPGSTTSPGQGFGDNSGYLIGNVGGFNISSGGSGGANAAVISQVSAAAAVEAISPAVSGAAQAFQAASQNNSNQLARQIATAAQASDKQTRILQAILDAIEGQPEQLAAEIQKRR